MTAPRPWWRKKRYAAPLALWLVSLYPLSGGLVIYAVGRGWLTRPAFDAAYAPAVAVHRWLGPRPDDPDPGPLALWFGAYEEDFLPHWHDLGRRHAASD